MLVEKKDIRNLNLKQLEDFFVSINESKFRAKQVYDWLWNKFVIDFDQMTNLELNLRHKLKNYFEFKSITFHQTQTSSDGTIKNTIKLPDENIIETVLIPTEKRITACISTQVGCSLDCTFCATATLERKRNLTSSEIVDQVIKIDQQSKKELNRNLTNIVFMGMGEPLLNYSSVVDAIKKITSDRGLNIAPKRITLSTSGIPKMIKKLADEDLKINLALSLHSAIEEKRNKIMPFSINFPLKELADALSYWYQTTNKKITLEYIVWKDFNDGEKDIKELIKFAKKFPSKINLIEYNSIGNSTFNNVDNEIIKKYIHSLTSNNLQVNVRKSRGNDIDAACGQLANKNP